jgi:hypothetical protein
VASEVSGLFECDICKFSSAHKGNFKQHLLSAKHRATKAAQLPQAPHPSVTAAALPPTTTSFAAASDSINKGVMIEMLEMFLNHMKHESDSQKLQQTVQFKTLTDRISSQQQQQQTIQIAETVTNTGTVVTNTQKFNLNLFLNEECKNAMNMNEFIQSVVITSEDLEHLGEVGYTEGMSKILTKAMRCTEATERPMHCTDVKRETIYVRKDDAWKKDEDCEETKRLIQHIAHKNYKALSEWREEHPEHTEPDTADYEAWYTISRNMCNTDPTALKKLIRHLALTTAVEKNQVSL